MSRRILVLGFVTADKSELGTPIYFGQDSDAAKLAVSGSELRRFETYQLNLPVKRSVNANYRPPVASELGLDLGEGGSEATPPDAEGSAPPDAGSAKEAARPRKGRKP